MSGKCPEAIFDPFEHFDQGGYLALLSYCVPFPLHAGKGKFCMWLVKKAEICFPEIGFVDLTWSNLNSPRSCMSLCPSLFGSTVWTQKGKRKYCMWLVKEMEFCFAKICFMDCKCPHTHLGIIHFLGSLWGAGPSASPSEAVRFTGNSANAGSIKAVILMLV